MDVVFALAVVVGLVIGLVFGAGAFTGHAIESRATRRHIDSLVTAEDHRAEAARLIHLAVRQRDVRYASYLRNTALAHCMKADLLENGPYASVASLTKRAEKH